MAVAVKRTIDPAVLADMESPDDSVPDQREEALAKGLECHCPFGCALEDCDEHGYCKHLKGFTNDRKFFETIQPLMRSEDGKLVDSGNICVMSGKRGALRQKVEKGDRLINPTEQYFDQGVWKTKEKWVSARVYRQ
jgi:hypothetical protein